MHFIEHQYGQFHVALSSKFSQDMNDIAIIELLLLFYYIFIYFLLLRSITAVAEQKAVA
jgi:hypothetical protein